ncbi:MAG: type IIL restriction-modification enzyme MmeI, partial [Thermomicrobiales bacterium]
DVLFPFLGGEDLNSRPDQSPSRWVINFRDWPIEKARGYPDCFRIIEEKVKPDRLKGRGRNPTADDVARRWWQFKRQARDLQSAIEGMERVLVTARVSPSASFAVAKTGIVFNEMLIVTIPSSVHHLGVLQSTQFWEWVRMTSATMGGTTIRFAATDCFETFPFPNSSSRLRELGDRFVRLRDKSARERGLGITDIVNQINAYSCSDDHLTALRALQVDINNQLNQCYGWADLDLGHGFHETKQGVRFTISEEARREVLDRLLELNHQRYAEEVAQGLHEKKNPARQVSH